MYPRVTTGQTTPDQEGNTAEEIRDALLPALREKWDLSLRRPRLT